MTTTTGDDRATDTAAIPRSMRTSARRSAAAVAALAALGVSELIAGILPGATSLVAAVGQVVDRPAAARRQGRRRRPVRDERQARPGAVRRRRRRRLIGRWPGRAVARRRYALAALGFAAFGVHRLPGGARRSAGQPRHGRRIGRRVGRRRPVGPRLAARTRASSRRDGVAATMPDWSRRSFLVRAGALGVGAVVAGVGRPPAPRATAPGAGGAGGGHPAGRRDGSRPSPLRADLSGSGAGPDSDRHAQRALLSHRYRPAHAERGYERPGACASTASSIARPRLSWDELVALPMFEQYATISCVSNEVGGKLVGNAKWTGVRLRDVLALAGVQASRQPAGRTVRGRLDRRHADGMGHGSIARADDRREDERRGRCLRSTGIRPASSSRACTATSPRPSGCPSSK